MKRITLAVGLTLIHGQCQLQLKRELPDEVIQLEDCQTGRLRTMTKTRLIKLLNAGEMSIVPVGGVPTVGNSDSTASQILLKHGLHSLSEAAKAQIDKRLRYLKGLQAGHVTRGDKKGVARVVKAVAQQVDDQSPPAASTVMTWWRRYDRSERDPISLLDRRQISVRPNRLDDKVEELISLVLRRDYLTRARHSLTHAYMCLRRELKTAAANGELTQEDAKVSFMTFSRRAKDIDVFQRIRAREGESRARLLCRTSIEGGAARYPLQRVEVDHTLLNWVVVCDRTGLPLGRPLLTIVMDAYSGYILGFYLSFYGAGVTSVVGALRSSMMPKGELSKELGLKQTWLSHGLADELVLDNGLEFHSKAFKLIAWELGIDMTFCRVRTPWLKPHVERFFGELNYLTIPKGRVRQNLANAVGLDPYKDAVIGFADLVKGMTMFVADVHPLQINERKLARPLDLFQKGLERCPPAIYPLGADKLRLVSGMSKALSVAQGGVQLYGIPYSCAELLLWTKELGLRFKALCKWDPDNLADLYVQHPTRPAEWVRCTSRWGEYTDGLSWNQHLLLRKFARSELRGKQAQEQLWEARERLHDHWLDAARPKNRKNSLLAARAAGLTSAGALGALSGAALTRTGETQPLAGAESQIVISDPFKEVDVPEFETFDAESFQ